MGRRQEEALRLAERVTDLRAQLKAAEAAFYALVPDEEPAPLVRTQPAPTDENRTVTGGSVADRLRALFQAKPGHTHSLADLLRALPGADPKTVRSTLGRLVKHTKEVEKVSRGKYRLRGSGSAPATTQMLRPLFATTGEKG